MVQEQQLESVFWLVKKKQFDPIFWIFFLKYKIFIFISLSKKYIRWIHITSLDLLFDIVFCFAFNHVMIWIYLIPFDMMDLRDCLMDKPFLFDSNQYKIKPIYLGLKSCLNRLYQMFVYCLNKNLASNGVVVQLASA